MGRLIDADKLCEGRVENDPVRIAAICEPTVDAVPVVHGRWEDEYGGEYVNPRYRCSVCKEKALFKFERDLLGHYREVQALTPNCPHCGAKMDLEENE